MSDRDGNGRTPGIRAIEACMDLRLRGDDVEKGRGLRPSRPCRPARGFHSSRQRRERHRPPHPPPSCPRRRAPTPVSVSGQPVTQAAPSPPSCGPQCLAWGARKHSSEACGDLRLRGDDVERGRGLRPSRPCRAARGFHSSRQRRERHRPPHPPPSCPRRRAPTPVSVSRQPVTQAAPSPPPRQAADRNVLHGARAGIHPEACVDLRLRGDDVERGRGLRPSRPCRPARGFHSTRQRRERHRPPHPPPSCPRRRAPTPVSVSRHPVTQAAPSPPPRQAADRNVLHGARAGIHPEACVDLRLRGDDVERGQGLRPSRPCRAARGFHSTRQRRERHRPPHPPPSCPRRRAPTPVSVSRHTVTQAAPSPPSRQAADRCAGPAEMPKDARLSARRPSRLRRRRGWSSPWILALPSWPRASSQVCQKPRRRPPSCPPWPSASPLRPSWASTAPWRRARR